ncbi:glutamate racemase [bacterium]|nr:glutamate racemase [bacterium]
MSFALTHFIGKLPEVIGILDSGVGGLSVMREIRAQLPEQPLTYIGDTAWCPYGNKDFSEIRDRTFILTDSLIEAGAEVIVVACNSATIVAIEALRSQYPIPFVGMEPGVKPAASLTKTGTIGVLATEASLAGEKFHRLVATHARDLRVITQPCPKFVELVERGILTGAEVEEAIDEYTSAILKADADVFILGCSHYPFLRPTLEASLPDHIQFIDTGSAIARRVKQQPLSSPTHNKVKVLTTGNPEQFSQLCEILIPEFQIKCQALKLP